MITFLFILSAAGFLAAIVCHHLKQKAEKALIAERERAEEAIANAQATIREKTVELDADAQRIREHYEAESRKIIEGIHAELQNARSELDTLRPWAGLQQSEDQVKETLSLALAEAAVLRDEAQAALEEAKQAALQERKEGQQRAKQLYAEAESLLVQATGDAGKMIANAEARARQISDDAYVALRDKDLLEKALVAIHNTIQGYGDRYVIPTHSLLDDLASDFNHTAAGRALQTARENTQRMAKLGWAATCEYEEEDRRKTAERFVVDAFNGRVDAILSRVKNNNFGTLEQEIRDAFNLVNLNAVAFRNARVQESYCDARISELKWAVVLQELKMKEREEQRRIQEQIREEEKARRDYERAMQEAANEEETIRKAMEKARAEAAHANAQDRAKFEAQLAELNTRLAEAEAKNQRALSMAQQTRSGHVYIISNVGSFGEDVLKIGMTRRLEPEDRIKELSDASVPFAFDVHAIIRSDDAPTLERMLHRHLDELRVNKVNYRKEFFRIPIQRLREFLTEKKLEATFTMAAEAREYRETQAYERMSPEERAIHRVKETADDPNETLQEEALN